MIDFSLPITQQAKFTAKTSELTVNYNTSEVDEEGVFDNVVFGYIEKGKKIISFPNHTMMELLPNTIALGTTKFSAHVAIKEASIKNPALCFQLNIANEKAWKVIEKINESYSIKELVDEEQKLPAIEVYFGEAGKQIFDTIKTIQHLLIEDIAFKDYWIDLKIEELILHCLQTDMRHNLINGYQKNCIPDHPLAFAIKHIKENIYKEIELGKLSNKAFMSKATFYRQFKHHFGMTPTQFIHQEKIKEAQKLLKKTDQSIAEIGYSLGYSTPSYFSKQFERIIGCVPRIYRNKKS